MKYPRSGKARKIGDGVFRGISSVYTFQVFPFIADLPDSAAVYIISRRITDRFGVGHHQTICIGEAETIVTEIRKHSRLRCAKLSGANVVCILAELDSSARQNAIDELTAARSFSCIRGVSKPTISATPDARKIRPIKKLPSPSSADTRAPSNTVVTPQRLVAGGPVAATARKGVQGGVDRQRGQHRLPKPTKPVSGRAKDRAAGRPRSRQKAAA